MAATELLKETGDLGDQKVAEEVASEIFSSWKFKGLLPKTPVLLFMGGFQGSGKTTVLEVLKKDLSLEIVSSDEIRHKLFSRGWQVGELFYGTVSAARNALIKKALTTGQNIAIDQFITRERIEVAKEILEKSGTNYKIILVYLDAPDNLLIERVRNRKPIPGKHNGTVEELEADFVKRGRPDYGMFDKVLDSSKETPEEIAEKIKPLFSGLS